MMVIETAGKVLVSARIENLADRYRVNRGEIQETEIRSIEVDDAVVDIRATGLSMPERLIRQLGLKPLRRQRARTIEGVISVKVYWPVGLTIHGRECPMDVAETCDDRPIVIGRIALTALDLIVNHPTRRLISDPGKDRDYIIEFY